MRYLISHATRITAGEAVSRVGGGFFESILLSLDMIE